MRPFMTLALVLCLCFALLAPAPVAAEPRSRGQEEGGLLSSLWSLLLPWWSPGIVGGSHDSAPATKEGCFIDPLGGGCQDTAPTTEEGCFIDPLG